MMVGEGSLDPVSSAVIAWLTGWAMTAGQSALGRMLGSDKQRRALSVVVQSAIDEALAEAVADDDRPVVKEALLSDEPDTRQLAVGDVLNLRHAVLELVEPRLEVLAEQGYHVDADRLSMALVDRISAGIQIEAARNGQLGPVADLLRHQGLMWAGKETVAQLREVNQHLEDALGRPIVANVNISGPPSPEVTAAHMLPPANSAFIGRTAELELVSQLVERAQPHVRSSGGVIGISAIGGMAGVGKTAFAVHAAHEFAPHFPDGQIFVRLHGHTPGQRPVEPSEALVALLRAVGVAAEQTPLGLEARAGLWRDRIAGKRLLVLLDDATGSDQVLPLLPGSAGSLVLVTSRRRLIALPEAMPITLNTLNPEEAEQLLVTLVARDDAREPVPGMSDVVRLCGYLPLAISLMAGKLKNHPAWRISDLASDLTSAKNRIATLRAENVSVAAAFDLSYQELSEEEQRLFRRLGLHPGTDVDAYAAAVLVDTDVDTARSLLDGLYVSHLADEPSRGRYRLHDLLREHALILSAADDSADSNSAIERLLHYYINAAQQADRHLARRSHTAARVPTGVKASYIPEITNTGQAVSWMEVERTNLLATANYAATNGRPADAIALAIAMHGFLRTNGNWDQALEIHRTALAVARATHDELGEAETLNNLGVIQRLTRDYPAARESLTNALGLYRKLNNPLGEANVLNYLGVVQRLTGKYPGAQICFTQALQIYQRLGNLLGQANALNYLGVLQQAVGDHQSAVLSQEQSLQLYQRLNDPFGEANVLSDLGAVQRLLGEYEAASESLRRALTLYEEAGSRFGQANALKYLGVVQEFTGDYTSSTASLLRALDLYRDVGSRLGEANVLKYLGIGRERVGAYEEAEIAFLNAQELYQKLGNLLGEANILNSLGDLALKTNELVKANSFYQQAIATARAGRVPFEEARGLEGNGMCHLRDGHDNEGVALLKQALSIYRALESPAVSRIEAILRGYGGDQNS